MVALAREQQPTARTKSTQAKTSRNAAFEMPATNPPVAATEQPRRKPTKTAALEISDNKKAQAIAMMRGPNGATLAGIMETTRWQKHTVRGFVSILGRKGGLKIGFSKTPLDTAPTV